MAIEINNGDLSGLLGDIDLTGIDTSRPILKPGLYVVIFTKFELKDNKKKDGKNLNVTMELTTEAESDDGTRKLAPKFPLFDCVSLVKLDNYNPLERLAQMQESALGAKKKGFNVQELIGRKVCVRVKKETSEEFGTQNRIGQYIKPPDPLAGQAAAVSSLNAI